MKTPVFALLLSILFGSFAQADQPSTHGMLLFGNQNTYASHLPMFHAPHDYQVILKLQLVDHFRTPTPVYYAEAKAAGETLFTIEPKPMDLTQIMDGSKTKFTADLYQGHFERGGKNLGPVMIKVEKVIYAKKLIAEGTAAAFSEYLIFGENGEYFAAHLIKQRPSFDTILQVTQPQLSICQPPVCHTLVGDTFLPLILSSQTAGPTNPAQTGDNIFSAEHVVTVLKNIYFETGDLAH